MVRQKLETEMADLTSRAMCIESAFDEYVLCIRARTAGCTLVPHFPANNIRRHAEPANLRRSTHGFAPEFPSELQPMRQLLAHGGSLSFSEEDMLSVHNATGRCECVDSTYHGVLSTVMIGQCDDHRGACKHDQLRRLCCKAATSEEAAEEVKAHCADFLCDYLYERERSKPAAQRCKPRYDAGESGDIDALLTALGDHPSVPGTGKGVATGETSTTDEAEGDSEESGAELDGDDVCQEAIEALSTLPRCSCTFTTSELQSNGFGLAFCENDEAGGGLVCWWQRTLASRQAHTAQPRPLGVSSSQATLCSQWEGHRRRSCSMMTPRFSSHRQAAPSHSSLSGRVEPPSGPHVTSAADQRSGKPSTHHAAAGLPTLEMRSSWAARRREGQRNLSVAVRGIDRQGRGREW